MLDVTKNDGVVVFRVSSSSEFVSKEVAAVTGRNENAERVQHQKQPQFDSRFVTEKKDVLLCFVVSNVCTTKSPKLMMKTKQI
jgi:hypothetical protein